jgi:hypothetical protein
MPKTRFRRKSSPHLTEPPPRIVPPAGAGSRRAPKPRTAFAVALAGFLIALSGCGGSEPARDPNALPKEVSGRTVTSSGISLDFSNGWQELPLSGRPYTQFYENTPLQISLGLSDFRSRGQSAGSMGDQIKQHFGNHVTHIESGPATIDGCKAYRLVTELKTDTGTGIVYSIAMVRPSGRATAIRVFSTADEQHGQREEIERLLRSIEVAE